MGTKSKGKARQVDFSGGMKMLSEMMDRKFIENTRHFTQSVSSLRVRLEAIEDLVMEKFGETEASLTERTLLRIEKMQGFEEVTTPVQKGSVIRIKLKEEVVGKESESTPLQDAFMAVGHNQINAAIDTLAIGAVAGQTLDVTLPDPDDSNIQRKITFTVMKVFKGDETNETQVVQEEQAPAENTGS